ncbi:hypothetical protein [Streptomyces sp. LN245]|uniref:hypothetical protein n=1 Tax=Streptomyces sp. LN245 TaxID=3112975 RepID=UPI0037191BDC
MPPGEHRDPTSLGRPLPGYRIVLCPPGTTTPAPEGEICVDLSDRPAGLMHGYLDGAPTPFAPGPLYRTGDLARQEDDGTLTFIGRLKDVFHTAGGIRVAPAELAARLLSHPAVAEASVVPVPAQRGPDTLSAKAYVRLADGWNNKRGHGASGPRTRQRRGRRGRTAGPGGVRGRTPAHRVRQDLPGPAAPVHALAARRVHRPPPAGPHARRTCP